MPRALVLLVVLVAAMTGCFASEDRVLTLRLDNDTGLLEEEDTYHAIYSDASPDDTTKARDDFEDLIETWLSDKQGVEVAKDGAYLKERRLWVEGGRLHGTLRAAMDEHDYFGEESGWTADSTGFYYQTDDSGVTTNGTLSGGRWYWPPEARVLIVKYSGSPSDTGHWQAEFATWYEAYVAEHGLDEYGHKVGAGTPGAPRR